MLEYLRHIVLYCAYACFLTRKASVAVADILPLQRYVDRFMPRVLGSAHESLCQHI